MIVDEIWNETQPTGILTLADGTIFEGAGIGAIGSVAAEVCFNTAMTGYEEILTDPSYAGQIVTFTFPHIGIVGTNEDDTETLNMAAISGVRGVVIRNAIAAPSNYRATRSFDAWLKARGIIGLSGVDTRALTAKLRADGLANAVIAYEPTGVLDRPALLARARSWHGLEGADLTPDVTVGQKFVWQETSWRWNAGYGRAVNAATFHVVVIDYGVKRNILRLLAGKGCRVSVVSATTNADDILALRPDGVFLSNGPGDPSAAGVHAVPTIHRLIKARLPIFGICLGHQLLGLALGGRTRKMHQGHHGANHPVKDLTTGKVEIVSMNHGFAVDADSLDATVEQTHISLFDGSNCGLRHRAWPIFSVQYHPEASPGPHDSHYLFDRFVALMETARADARPSA